MECNKFNWIKLKCCIGTYWSFVVGCVHLFTYLFLFFIFIWIGICLSWVLRWWWWWIEAIGMHWSAVFDQMPWIIVVKMTVASIIVITEVCSVRFRLKQVSRFIPYLSHFVWLSGVQSSRPKMSIAIFISVFFFLSLCRFKWSFPFISTSCGTQNMPAIWFILHSSLNWQTNCSSFINPNCYAHFFSGLAVHSHKTEFASAREFLPRVDWKRSDSLFNFLC